MKGPLSVVVHPLQLMVRSSKWLQDDADEVKWRFNDARVDGNTGEKVGVRWWRADLDFDALRPRRSRKAK